MGLRILQLHWRNVFAGWNGVTLNLKTRALQATTIQEMQLSMPRIVTVPAGFEKKKLEVLMIRPTAPQEIKSAIP